MKKYKLLIVPFVFAWVVITLVSCSQATTPAELPTEVALATEEATLPPTQIEDPTASPVPTDPPTAEPTEEESDPDESDPSEDIANSATTSDHCVACHTDQQKLIDTADPVEEVESENEGAG